MNIKERIERLGMYFHSMNVAAENNIIYVRVQFPKGWGCSELTEYNFNVKSVTDEIPGYFYFFANMEIGFDKIFDAIEFNIQFNEEAQAKVSLLREKIEELKDIFENEDINVLRTLEFKYKKKKPKSIKSQKTVTGESKEIVEPVSETPISEENNSDKIDNK
jgi:hypothetical protein